MKSALLTLLSLWMFLSASPARPAPPLTAFEMRVADSRKKDQEGFLTVARQKGFWVDPAEQGRPSTQAASPPVVTRSSSPPPRPASPPQEKKRVPLEEKSVMEYRDKAWNTVKGFCSAPDAESLLAFIREPERVGPALRAYYKADNPWKPIPMGNPPDPGNWSATGNFAAIELQMPDFSTKSMALEDTTQGFKVDWESFVAWSELSWKELREKRPTKPVLIRAILRSVGYYNYDFPSEKTHQSIQLTDTAEEEVLYGYVVRDSDIATRLKELMRGSSKAHAIIKVAYPANSTASNQVEIVEVLSRGWILNRDQTKKKTR